MISTIIKVSTEDTILKPNPTTGAWCTTTKMGSDLLDFIRVCFFLRHSCVVDKQSVFGESLCWAVRHIRSSMVSCDAREKEGRKYSEPSLALWTNFPSKMA